MLAKSILSAAWLSDALVSLLASLLLGGLILDLAKSMMKA
jgi:hypothetical protein